ncbi:MAG: hypothetical protein M3349_03160 [Actinomycetota bacterium]|nr:hypothetical protein [Actinomycetota bacterium]
MRARCVLLALTTTAVLANMPAAYGENPGAGSLTPWRLTGVLMVDGGAGAASEANNYITECPVIHGAIEDYLAAAPWVTPPEGAEDVTFTEMDHVAINEAETAMLNAWRNATFDPDPTPFVPLVTEFCSVEHHNGWLAATASLVESILDPDDYLDVIATGTRDCEFGELLLGSASYVYDWEADTWWYAYGNDPKANDETYTGTWSNEITLACATLFAPSDIAEVAEATPDTQVNVNPAIKGLTQLDHWLWYDFTDPASYLIGPLTASVPAMGFTWTIETEAWVDQILWDIDCVTVCDYRDMAAGFDTSGYEYVSDQPDTELAPADVYYAGIEADDEAAFEHVYTQLGDVTISTAAIWRGTYVVTNNLPFGSASFPILYDPVVVADTHTMPVISIRAELRNDPPPGA